MIRAHRETTFPACVFAPQPPPPPQPYKRVAPYAQTASQRGHHPLSWRRYVSDYLPTFLDVVGVPHAQPGWAADGISLMPFIRMARAPSIAGPPPSAQAPRAPPRAAVFLLLLLLLVTVRLSFQSQTGTAVDVAANRSTPLGFQLGDQQAWIDNDWKVVRNPKKGQCKV